MAERVIPLPFVGRHWRRPLAVPAAADLPDALVMAAPGTPTGSPSPSPVRRQSPASLRPAVAGPSVSKSPRSESPACRRAAGSPPAARPRLSKSSSPPRAACPPTVAPAGASPAPQCCRSASPPPAAAATPLVADGCPVQRPSAALSPPSAVPCSAPAGASAPSSSRRPAGSNPAARPHLHQPPAAAAVSTPTAEPSPSPTRHRPAGSTPAARSQLHQLSAAAASYTAPARARSSATAAAPAPKSQAPAPGSTVGQRPPAATALMTAPEPAGMPSPSARSPLHQPPAAAAVAPASTESPPPLLHHRPAGSTPADRSCLHQPKAAAAASLAPVGPGDTASTMLAAAESSPAQPRHSAAPSSSAAAPASARAHGTIPPAAQRRQHQPHAAAAAVPVAPAESPPSLQHRCPAGSSPAARPCLHQPQAAAATSPAATGSGDTLPAALVAAAPSPAAEQGAAQPQAAASAVKPAVAAALPAASSPLAAPSSSTPAASADAAAVEDPFLGFLPHGATTAPPTGEYIKCEEGWRVYLHKELTPRLKTKLLDGLRARRHSSFAGGLSELPGYCGIDGPLKIPLIHDRPIWQPARRHSDLENEIGDAKCIALRDAGIIVRAPPDCQYACNTTMPAKKDPDGNWTDRRFCTDYRPINAATIPDRYGLHHPDDVFRDVSSSCYYSKLDMTQAFLQVPVVPEDQPKTTFWWRNQMWMYRRMPYGLVSGSSKCQRIMDLELAAAGLSDRVATFIDDAALHTKAAGGLEGHIDSLFELLDALGRVGLRLHPSKCSFLLSEMALLGHFISPAGLSPEASKVAAIQALTSPANLKELQSKLAFINYYRAYIPNFSTISAPLNELLRKGAVWTWEARQEHAFSKLKEVVCTPGIVLRPFKSGAPTILYTDWSNVGIAAVLHQEDADGQEHLVACLSRSLNPHERNYGSYEGELLAAVWGIKSFRLYLHGLPFKLVTDHQPLKWLMANQQLTGKHARWALMLQEFIFTVEHRPGTKHVNADVPSRYPYPSSEDRTGACLDPHPTPSAALAMAASAFPTCDLHGLELDECSLLDSADMFAALAPTASELFENPPPFVGEDSPAAAAVALAEHLQGLASCWFTQVLDQLPNCSWRPQPLQCQDGTADRFGVQETEQLCTAVVGPLLFEAARLSGPGIVLYEPFGGLCAGLDMVLSNGLRVLQYYYSDTDPAAQAVAQLRVDSMHALYPHLFPRQASEGAFDTLPMDVRQVNTACLLQAGASLDEQWLVVAGWSCEDLSPAGKGKGLRGARSSNFWDAVRIVGTLQQLQTRLPPGFIMENTAMQASWGHEVVRKEDFPLVCQVLGAAVLLDAAQLGAGAHRLRNYWTNLASPEVVALVLAQAKRAPGCRVDELLDPGRVSGPAQTAGQHPFYPCNVVGEPLYALPTLVAFPASRAFRNGKQGMVWDSNQQCWDEPNPDERERLMGYPTGCTAAAGLTSRDRHAITGRAMDRHAMVHLLAVCIQLAKESSYLPEAAVQLPARQPPLFSDCSVPVRILQRWGWQLGGPLLSPNAHAPLVEPVELVANPGTQGLGYQPGKGRERLQETHAGQAAVAVAQLGVQLDDLVLEAAVPGPAHTAACVEVSPATPVYSEGELHRHYCAVATAAALQDAVEKAVGSKADPHLDTSMLSFLREGQLPDGLGAKEATRVRRRAARYSLVDGQLQRKMGDGSRRTVPPAAQRKQLIKDTHERTGHFGLKRTRHLLLASFWWPGLEQDVRAVLSACEPCARVRASFCVDRPHLHPLPIAGLFYRWGVDMAGPFAASKDGNLYVLIMVEYFSKTVELVAVQEKSARCNAYAFLSAVLSRYGACAEVITDRGSEFDADFHALLHDCLIDHRRTSPNHPQADGLAERAVQTIKKALTKHVAQHREMADWDWQLHWVALGYRASKQAASRLSPYELLFGTQPVIPPAIKQRMEEPLLDFADPEQAAEYLLQRADLLRRHCVIAMGNLRVAQHRDTLRYEQVRSGAYIPVRQRLAVGDFVYVRRRTVVNSLQSEAKPGIYRITELRPSGVVVVQGRCGRTMHVNVAQCAPCHLTNINPVLDPALQQVDADFPCAVCDSPDDEEVMVLCDGCFRGFHIYCLQPPLAAVPEEDVWVCPDCTGKGVTAEALAVLRQQNLPVAQSDAAVFPNVQQRQHDAAAQVLAGKVVWLADLALPGKLEYVPRAQRQELQHSRCALRAVVEGQPPVYLSLKKAQRLVKEGVPAESAQATLAGLPPELSGVFVAAAEPAEQLELGTVVPALAAPVPLEQAFQDWCGVPPAPDLLAAAQATCEQLATAPRGQELGIAHSLVEVLMLAVDLRHCGKFAVAGGCCEAVASCLQHRFGKVLWQKDKLPGQGMDQLSPVWYKQAHVRAPLDWVFGCPPEGVLELALGLAAQQAHCGLAMLVPHAVLTNHSQVLATMLQQYAQQERLVLLTSGYSDAAWLVVFVSSAHERAMVSVRGMVHDTGWLLAGLE